MYSRIDNPVILVTGGAGYIGAHACKALARAGYRPVVYDKLAHGRPYAVKWGPLELGDILDRSRLDEVIAKCMPFAIMHFAAFAYVGESIASPGNYRWAPKITGLEDIVRTAWGWHQRAPRPACGSTTAG